MRAVIEIETKAPETILKALKPDISENNRFKISLSAGKDKIILNIETEEISSMLAAINSYLRLISAAKEVS